jgi:hypothetical protein
MFQAAYRAARLAVYSQSIARQQQASPIAASTLLKVMIDANTKASVKVRACECVFAPVRSLARRLRRGTGGGERQVRRPPTGVYIVAGRESVALHFPGAHLGNAVRTEVAYNITVRSDLG